MEVLSYLCHLTPHNFFKEDNGFFRIEIMEDNRNVMLSRYLSCKKAFMDVEKCDNKRMFITIATSYRSTYTKAPCFITQYIFPHMLFMDVTFCLLSICNKYERRFL